ncbi:MAG: ferrous iron transporter B [Phycisphaerales bacterium JB063]
MSTISLKVQQPKRTPPGNRPLRVALVGNPNCGKTTLFNRLTGLRAKTSNFPGTTLECRTGKLVVENNIIDILDLPGLYSTQHAQSEELLAAQVLHSGLPGVERPDAVVVVIDATCLARHLYLASEVREMGIPLVVALTMMDEARQQGLTICLDTLGKELDAVIVPVSGRTGEGMAGLSQAIVGLSNDPELAAQQASGMTERIACTACSSCPHTNRHTWACGVGEAAAPGADQGLELGPKTEKVDRALTHPFIGLVFFSLLMAGLFITLFKLAGYPMDWIDAAFGALGETTGSALLWIDARLDWGLADSLLASFLIDGVIGGVGGVVIFLPQICLLFLILTLLEDTGYLARAAVVADRIMHKVGLPGKAFIPMLSAHACAIPAIMSTKTIETRRDRLITILVLPLMTCSARLPVYAMIIALLFADNALMGGVVFYGAYALGIAAAMGASFVFGKTILKGKPQELVIELPPYRWPSIRVALLTVWDRALVFLKQAGTVILVISIILWVLLTFPQAPEDRLPDIASAADQSAYVEYAEQAQSLEAELESLGEDADEALLEAKSAALDEAAAARDNLHARYASEYSIAGRAGKLIEPVFAPLGFDWRIDIGVVASFAAREVVVSTLAIVGGIGEDAAEDNDSLVAMMNGMKRPDGSPLFTMATALSLLVFFVLAMQCLPTQAVTKRETGSWKWAILQFGYMTTLAYTAALVTYQVVSALT